jgi:hypothetical protein
MAALTEVTRKTTGKGLQGASSSNTGTDRNV